MNGTTGFELDHIAIPAAPSLDIFAFPEEHRSAVFHMEMNLHKLESLAGRILAGAELYRFAFLQAMQLEWDQRIGSRPSKWCHLAIEQGASDVWQYSYLIEQTSGELGKVPGLRECIDHDVRKEAIRRFNDRFPKIASVRNALCHSGELGSTPAKSEKNSTGDSSETAGVVGAGGTIFGSMLSVDKATLSQTYEGEWVHFVFDEESVRIIAEVTGMFFGAFEGAAYKRFRPSLV